MKIDYIIMKSVPKPLYTYEDILHSVSKSLNIPIEVLTSKTRKRPIVYARFIFFYLAMNNVNGATYLGLGRFIGFNHATIIHGIKSYKENMVYSDFQELVKKVKLCVK